MPRIDRLTNNQKLDFGVNECIVPERNGHEKVFIGFRNGITAFFGSNEISESIHRTGKWLLMEVPFGAEKIMPNFSRDSSGCKYGLAGR